MASDLILSLREVDVHFGKKQIFHNLDLNIHRGDLIALVGKNGIGKTTLMKIIEGSQDLDNGELWQYPGLSVSYFSQQLEVQDDILLKKNLIQPYILKKKNIKLLNDKVLLNQVGAMLHYFFPKYLNQYDDDSHLQQ